MPRGWIGWRSHCPVFIESTASKWPQLKEPEQKNNTSTWQEASSAEHDIARQLPKEKCSPLHPADEILSQKKSQSNYFDPEKIWVLSQYCVRGCLNGTVAERGKMNY